MKFLHASLALSLLFTQVPGKKPEVDPIQAKTGRESWPGNMTPVGVEMPIGGMQQKPKPYVSPAEQFEYKAGDVMRTTIPEMTFLYSGGRGKDDRMWPIEKILDEKLEPILKAIQEHNSPVVAGTAPTDGVWIVRTDYCEHEWEDSEFAVFSTRASFGPAKLEVCKQCGLLRIKK